MLWLKSPVKGTPDWALGTAWLVDMHYSHSSSDRSAEALKIVKASSGSCFEGH